MVGKSRQHKTGIRICHCISHLILHTTSVAPFILLPRVGLLLSAPAALVALLRVAARATTGSGGVAPIALVD
jgi:hypothetical protein